MHNLFPWFVHVNYKEKMDKKSEFGEGWVYEKAGGGNGWWHRDGGGVWWVARGEKVVVWGCGACDDERKRGRGCTAQGWNEGEKRKR
jgi:hypothetical protein